MATERITIPIDRAGRLVLPKSIRDRLGIQAGSEFEVLEEEDKIILKPVEREPKLVSKDGVLVFVPEADFSNEGEDVVKKVREERDRRNW